MVPLHMLVAEYKRVGQSFKYDARLERHVTVATPEMIK